MSEKLIKPVNEAIFWAKFILSGMIVFSCVECAFAKVEENYSLECYKAARLERSKVKRIAKAETSAPTYSNVVEVELKRRAKKHKHSPVVKRKIVEVKETTAAVLPAPPTLTYEPHIKITPHR